MTKKTKEISLFEGKEIRKIWDDNQEKWYFSVVDIVIALEASKDSRKYWNKLSQRLREEGSEVVTKCHQLKMMASDGKYYLTDTADTETIFRIIQSIPSPKAEPFKLWLARVGYERVEETEDPGLRTKEYKKIKNLKKENLRDNMTNLELVLNMLAEASTTEISKKIEPKDFKENRKVAKKGGGVARKAKNELEKQTGKSVISKNNLLLNK